MLIQRRNSSDLVLIRFQKRICLDLHRCWWHLLVNVNQQYCKRLVKVWRCVPFSVFTLFGGHLDNHTLWMPESTFNSCGVPCRLKRFFSVQLVSWVICLLYEGDLYIGLLYFFKCSHFFLFTKYHHNNHIFIVAS